MSKIITEETEVKFDNYSDLSYNDNGSKMVELFVKGESTGKIEVFTDRENENREYVCINYEMVYLDTITKLSV